MPLTPYSSTPYFTGLSPWERRGLIALVLVFLVFGLVVEKRSAFMQRRMTDLGVYLRAAWAVRAGEDIYDIQDDNGWHYQYPPLFAILLVPLADPPQGVDRTGYVSYPVSVAIWYIVSLACLIGAVHQLASALEEKSSSHLDQRPTAFCRRWWGLRVLPIVVCLTPLGHTLMRGQVNLLLLALLCAMAAALLRHQPVRAGLWLAGAICLKVIPAFLLLIPLWRRDARCLASCLIGLFVGLVIIPASVFGPARTIAYYKEYDEKLLRPGLGKGTDQSRAKELIEMTANDSQSILAAIHNSLYPDRLQRPPHPTEDVRRIAQIIGGVLTVITLMAAGWRRQGTGIVLFLGMLILDMLLLSPICHLHYFSLSVPLVMGILDASWKGNPNPKLDKGLWFLFGANLIGNTLPHLPGMELFRELGLAMYAALALWLTALVLLWKEEIPAEIGAWSFKTPASSPAVE
ncbi:MAG TPA: glycosyltransferase family 87 protein [Gemmataceae bacterium]|nr:glycosyltransferase family 87 protein [Gemmataceae bacterium]